MAICRVNEMSRFSDFLSKKTQEFIENNDKECIIAAQKREKWLITKINNWHRDKFTEHERNTYTTETILKRIETDDLFRVNFRKDFTRQTIHEKAQIEWIQLCKYPDAIKIKSDKGGTCLSGNKIHVISKTNPRPSNATKTFDMYIPSKKNYCVMKHTTCPGGSQNNQFADVKEFIQKEIDYLLKNPGADETFSAYLDGPYYTPKKMKELEEMIPKSLNGKIWITSCASIVSNTI